MIPTPAAKCAPNWLDVVPDALRKRRAHDRGVRALANAEVRAASVNLNCNDH